MLTIDGSFYCSLLLLAYAVVHLLWRNDEMPLIIAGLTVQLIWRGMALQNGYADWVTTDYGISTNFSLHWAETACNYILLGGVVMAASYSIFWSGHPVRRAHEEQVLGRLLAKQKNTIMAGAVISGALAIYASAFVSEYGGQVRSAYLFYFPLVNSAFIILSFMLWRRRDVAPGYGLIALILVLFVAWFTFKSTTRFRFLGWAIVVAFMMGTQFKPMLRLLIYCLGGLFIGLAFSMVGVMREPAYKNYRVQQLITVASQKVMAAQDVNMVDGFVMLMQAYPEHLDYGYGREHLEILLRPIPRAWWPTKPVGSWHQKLARQKGWERFTTGISPSIFGSFYAEAGVAGIAIISAIYGIGLAGLVRFLGRYRSMLGVALRGMVAASLLALFRGGDIPGILAIIGLSYWPMGIFLWLYHRGQKRYQAEMRMPQLGAKPVARNTQTTAMKTGTANRLPPSRKA